MLVEVPHHHEQRLESTRGHSGQTELLPEFGHEIDERQPVRVFFEAKGAEEEWASLSPSNCSILLMRARKLPVRTVLFTSIAPPRTWKSCAARSGPCQQFESTGAQGSIERAV